MSTSRPENSTRGADAGEADLRKGDLRGSGSRHTDPREADLIDRWLDEGDRLSEDGRTVGPSGAFQTLGGLAADRRRFAYVLAAVAVLAIAVGATRALSRAPETSKAESDKPPAVAPNPVPAVPAPTAPPAPPVAAAPAPAPEQPQVAAAAVV